MSSDGSDVDLTKEGLMTRLDDKLDALERAGRLSRPQLAEQYVGGGFEDGSTPPPAVRIPLARAVRDLTAQWSEGYLALAYEGDGACMFMLAQMSFRPGGYGSLPFNKAAGLQWLFKAVDAGDLSARAWARRVVPDELITYLARKELGPDVADRDADALTAAVERWRIKDADMAREEQLARERLEKELGGE